MQSWSKQEMQVVMITNTQRKEVKERKKERECLYSSLIQKPRNQRLWPFEHTQQWWFKTRDAGSDDHQHTKGKEGRKQGRKGKERKRRKKENACTLSCGHDTCVVGGCVFCEISKMKQQKQSNEFSNWWAHCCAQDLPNDQAGSGKDLHLWKWLGWNSPRWQA